MDKRVKVRVVEQNVTVATPYLEFVGVVGETYDVSESDYQEHLAGLKEIELVEDTTN